MFARYWILVVCLCLVSVQNPVRAQFPSPILSDSDGSVVSENFDQPHELEKTTYLQRQGTRWSIEAGVLRGRPSSNEYQASRDHHRGYEPRISLPSTPSQFQATFSIRFVDGKETAIVPFIEFGHHVCRVRFSEDGVALLADGETMKLAEVSDFQWKSGQWYHVTAEMVGPEFVFQIKDGPKLYAKWKSFSNPPKTGGNGLGVAGPKGGKVEIDNLTISKAKPAPKSGWELHKKQFPKFAPIQIKEPKKKKRAK